MTYAAVRFLGYVAAFALIGATVFRIWLVPRIDGTTDQQIEAMVRRAVRAARLAAVGLAIAILCKLYFQSRSMIEPDEALSFDIVRLVIGSRWGQGWLAQGLAALVALLGWRAMARTRPAPWARGLVLLAAGGLILAMPLTGHAIGLPAAGRLGYPLTVLHVGGGALWLGTLGIMVVVVLRRVEPRLRLGPLIRAYSTIALPAGLLAIGCGLVVAWRYLGGLAPLASTEYGNVLAAKLALVAVIAATGAYNWRSVLPRLEIGQSAPLTRSATFEVAIGIILLAVTAVLVSLPAPSELAE